MYSSMWMAYAESSLESYSLFRVSFIYRHSTVSSFNSTYRLPLDLLLIELFSVVQSLDDSDVTLTSQLSVDRFHMLEPLAKHWRGWSLQPHCAVHEVDNRLTECILLYV